MLTEEQERILTMVKIMLGDLDGNPFHPLLADEEYIIILEQFNWNWRRAVPMLGYTIQAMSAGWFTRERTGDIEVELDFGKNFKAYLANLLEDLNSPKNINISPYAGGIDWDDFLANEQNPNNILAKLNDVRACCFNSANTKQPRLF